MARLTGIEAQRLECFFEIVTEISDAVEKRPDEGLEREDEKIKRKLGNIEEDLSEILRLSQKLEDSYEEGEE